MNRRDLLGSRLIKIEEFVAEAKGMMKAGPANTAPTNGARPAPKPLRPGSELWYLLADVGQRLPEVYGHFVSEAAAGRDVTPLCRSALRELDKAERVANRIMPSRRTPQQRMLARRAV